MLLLASTTMKFFSKILRTTALLSFGCFLTSHIAHAQPVSSNDSPLLTIGVISDIHNQHTLINPSSVDNVKLRGSFETVLSRMKQEENLDMLIFGGDYTSDVTIPEANFNRIRELVINAGRSVFGAEIKPVLYVIGNHDFEVANFDALPKQYNAGDFYAPMQSDIGELDENSVFYEEADNSTSSKMKLLAAYHYVIDGFDFVVLNCGKYFFKSAWDYTYSEESVNWVKNKLEEIYADDPDKTVFFLCHMPFRDSKRMSSPDKGISNHPATQTLKWTLAKYPDLIYLYGHDHGTDSAYIRTSTAERVTEYDSNGYAIGQSTASQSLFCLQNKAGLTYLGTNDYNLYPTTEKATCSITASASYFNIKLPSYPSGVSGPYLYIGSNGRFSLNAAAANLRFFEVVSESDGTITAEQVTDGTVHGGAEYVITAVQGGSDYAVTNEPYSAGSSSQRIVGDKSAISITGTTLTYTDPNPSDKYSAVWTVASSNTAQLAIKDIVGNYLGVGTDNLNVVPNATACTINYSSADNYYNIITPVYVLKDQTNVYCGSSGRFSLNGNTVNLRLFKVVSESDGTVTAEQSSGAIIPNEKYLIVGVNSSNNYALTNEQYPGNGSTGSTRLIGVSVSITGTTLTYTDSNPSDDYSALWQFTTVEEAAKSFVSTFVGSMRYYNNSIDGGSSPNNSRIVQAMIIYVYSDKIVLQMKNYGETGTINGVTINKDLEPYTIIRTVKDIETGAGSPVMDNIQISQSGRNLVVKGGKDCKIDIFNIMGQPVASRWIEQDAQTIDFQTKGQIVFIRVQSKSGFSKSLKAYISE